MRLPTLRCLEAFATAARYESFSRAAEELNTTQSSISRYIAELEARLGAQLFTRKNQRVQLSEKGSYFFRVVETGLGNISSAMDVVSDWSREEPVIIACSHAVSHLVLMPRFESLQNKMGTDARLRVLAFEYDVFDLSVADRVDLVLTYDATQILDVDHAILLPEIVTPICSPEFARANAAILDKPVTQWSEVPFLNMNDDNLGWATWGEWFDKFGGVKFAPRFQNFRNYAYLLEAATAGSGLALGWHGYIERHIESKALVTVGQADVSLEHAMYGVLTQRGRDRHEARRCLKHLATLIRR